ncbi:MAG: glucuronate isomerase, partial [Mucinivorans sp.]
MATMAASFNQGPTPSKVQYGAAWWFLDSFDGITSQIEALSSSGLLAHFVGMLTDSRSILSYPRHEYFRRILCNILGRDLAMGRLPASEFDFIGRMVEDISYNNAINYFGFKK